MLYSGFDLLQRILCCALLMAGPRLHGDIGLILSEPTGEGASFWTSAGHSAIYLSRICPKSPVEMRLCAPGEPGSMLTSYQTFAEDSPYQWNLAPLNVYLYGVEDERLRPLYASPAIRQKLQDRFLRRYLAGICTGPACTTDRKAHWRDMVAASFVREVYMFHVKTTLDQDLALIAKFNTLANQNHYNGFTYNCADFAREVINTYFPNAARPDRVNDFGLTSPKAISKSFSHYGERHPELEFHVLRFAQIPGHYPPSSECRKGTEVAFRSKKWLFPLLLKSHELGLFTASYWLTGRFNPHHELRRRPSARAAQIEAEIAAGSQPNASLLQELQQEKEREREHVMGSVQEWNNYSIALNRLVDQSKEKGLITSHKELRRLLRDLDKGGDTLVDENGEVWLDLRERGVVRRAGLSASNINAPGSDPQLAFLIMLARMDYILRSPGRRRELLPQFKADWGLLENTHARLDWPGSEIKVAAGAARSELSNTQLGTVRRTQH